MIGLSGVGMAPIVDRGARNENNNKAAIKKEKKVLRWTVEVRTVKVGCGLF